MCIQCITDYDAKSCNATIEVHADLPFAPLTLVKDSEAREYLQKDAHPLIIPVILVLLLLLALLFPLAPLVLFLLSSASPASR